MTLKQKNRFLLSGYSLGQIIVFGLFSMRFNFSDLELENLLKPGLISLFLMILSVILNGLIPEPLKATLVFWKIKNPLPGSEAFSKHMHSDPRIDVKALKSSIGTIPHKPEEQNRLWYKIYKKHANTPIILNAHREYLLTRDLTQLSFLFLIFLGMASIFIFEQRAYILSYLLLLIFLYLVTSLAAKNYGVRFVNNVLALESSN